MYIFIKEYQDKKCKTYSGGTLRKLQSVLASIGDPAILVLDELTAGVDPASRRQIWYLINNLRESGHSILISSHRYSPLFFRCKILLISFSRTLFFSDDECEALCTRLAVVMKGQVCSIGETMFIKDMYERNYTLWLKTSIKATEEDRLKLQNAVEDVFKPGCQLMSDHMVNY